MERISIFIPSLERGGIERNIVYLSQGFLAQGYGVDLLVTYIAESFLKQIPSSVRIVHLHRQELLSNFLGFIPYRVRLAISLFPDFLSYLRREKPKVLISFQSSVLAAWARELLRLDTRLIVRESNTPSEATSQDKHWFGRIVPYLKRWSYPRADAVVAVSEGVANDLSRVISVPRERINVIYAPTFNDMILEKAKESLDHPWFRKGEPPVILGVGRLTRQKDFRTLLKAFALVRKEFPARLVILGEGEDRTKLEVLAKELGVYEDIDMPGFVENPYKYLAQAKLFVLSSRYEGMPNVLVESLVVGTPAIATNCPSGPDEVLPGETLVPVGDYRKMAEKIIELLRDDNKARQILKEAQKHLDRFNPETNLKKYLALVQERKMNKKIAFFLPPLGDGGVERTVLKLAGTLAKSDYDVDVLTVKAQGPFLQKVDSDVEIIDLNAGRTLTSLTGLVRYLRRKQPDILISAQYYANVIAIWAKFLARVSTRVIVTERLALSLTFGESRKWKDKFLSFLMRLSYPRADAIVAVSRGAAKDLAQITGIKEEKIQVIYNPTLDDEILKKANEFLDHPWFKEKKFPIILGAGRLTNQKDFSTLIRAFAHVRQETEAKLVILGEGENRRRLEDLARELEVAEDVDMPGFVENPYKYMAKVDLFVLSSKYEGMPNVVIEAMAVGTPVIATDIPTGARELLPREALVPVADDKKIAEKINQLLNNYKKIEELLAKERESLEQFRPENSLRRYVELIEQKVN